MTDEDAWQRYVAAMQRLDAVVRGSAAMAERQATAQSAVRTQLTGVRERLAKQRIRLRELGVPEVDLVPSPPEVAVAAAAAGREPDGWSATLRRAGASADAADAQLSGPGWGGRRLITRWARLRDRAGMLGLLLAALIVVGAVVGALLGLLALVAG